MFWSCIMRSSRESIGIDVKDEDDWMKKIAFKRQMKDEEVGVGVEPMGEEVGGGVEPMGKEVGGGVGVIVNESKRIDSNKGCFWFKDDEDEVWGEEKEGHGHVISS